MKTQVAGGRLIDPASGVDAVADIWIADGVIVGIGARPLGFEADQRIDAAGRCVLPGLVDLSFTPGPQHDWQGAFAGGITTVAVADEAGEAGDADAASESRAPALGSASSGSSSDAAVLSSADEPIPSKARSPVASGGIAPGSGVVSRASNRSFAPRILRVGPMCSSVSGQQLSDFGRLRQAGCIAWSPGRPSSGSAAATTSDVAAGRGLDGNDPTGRGHPQSTYGQSTYGQSIYGQSTGRPGSAGADPHLLWRAMQYARGLGGALWLPPVDAALARGGVAGAGAYAARLALDSVPVVAETLALAQIFALQRDTGARVHLSQITSAEGVALVRDAKREGLPITCDVAAHHLHVIDLDIGFYDPRYRLDPPLRGSRDRDALRAGLADDTIDAVCSHHRVVAAEHADAPFAYAGAGAADGPLLASLVLKWARETGVAPLQALAKITTGPAAVVAATQPALPRAGRLEVGVPADFCLFDIDDFWLVPAGEARGAAPGTTFYGRTPFSGMPMTGRVTATYIHGECVWRAAQ
ncbi:amidohydrolase family protein [Alcaligenaceae bacterium C4P045]|nr:amidohydrolase family protein [Alcaligenaceae bacterium C4P045]